MEIKKDGARRCKGLLIATMVVMPLASAQGETASFTVTLVRPVNGTLQVVPPIPPDGKYLAGTVVTLRATPARGYVLDSAWYSVPGIFGEMYHEGMGSEFVVTVDRDQRIGASFIEEEAVRHVDVTHDVVYAKPGVKPLKYDVFSPKGVRNLPIIVIIHGGGWVANDENIMRGLARELTNRGRFVVCSMDYRWAGKADGDAASTTMVNIIEDVFGGIAHILEHASAYGGDPTRIGVTGDSAGGHLSAAAALMPGMIGDRGFGKTPGVFEFMPSYVPKSKTVAQVRTELVAAIKAVAPSYGVFRAARLKLYTDDPASDESWSRAVAPLQHIPAVKERTVPVFQLRGTRDPIVHHDDAQEFLDALVAGGQRAEYTQVGGAEHAFFDWKPDEKTQATFARYGVYHGAAMKAFFESVLY